VSSDERELRRALETRSGEVSPEFRRRLSGTFLEGRPAAKAIPALALMAVIVLSGVSIGILLMARGADRVSHGDVATPPPTPSQIVFPHGSDMSAASGSVLWVYFVQGSLFRSTDRGDTWERRPLPTVQGGGSPQISFVDAQHGWYLVSNSPRPECSGQDINIWHTSDGGATWEPLGATGVDYVQCKESLSFVDPNHGFLAAWDYNHQPTMYRTADGGSTWQRATLPDPSSYTTPGGGVELHVGVVKRFGSTLLVAAADNQSSEYVFRSIDGGGAWTYVAHTNGALARVVFVTASRWLLVQNHSGWSETTDAGKTWHSFPNDYSDAAGDPSDFVFGDDSVGYGTAGVAIHRTVDGGSHWTDIKTPGT